MRILGIALVLAALVFSPAQAYNEQDQARKAVRAGEIKSLSEIRRQVRRNFDGRIVDVELKGKKKGRPRFYDVKLLSPRGHVLTIRMDAKSARILRVRGKR